MWAARGGGRGERDDDRQGGREGGRADQEGESGEERGTNLRPVARKLDSAREVSRDLGNPSLPIGAATCAGVQRAGGNVWKPRIRGDTTRPRRRWRWRPTRAPRERHYSQLCQARRSSRTLFNRSRLRVTLSRTHTPPHTHTLPHTHFLLLSLSLGKTSPPRPPHRAGRGKQPLQADATPQSHTCTQTDTHARPTDISHLSVSSRNRKYIYTHTNTHTRARVNNNTRPSCKKKVVLRLRLSAYCCCAGRAPSVSSTLDVGAHLVLRRSPVPVCLLSVSISVSLPLSLFLSLFTPARVSVATRARQPAEERESIRRGPSNQPTNPTTLVWKRRSTRDTTCARESPV